jgi:hypothetical protein
MGVYDIVVVSECNEFDVERRLYGTIKRASGPVPVKLYDIHIRASCLARLKLK